MGQGEMAHLLLVYLGVMERVRRCCSLAATENFGICASTRPARRRPMAVGLRRGRTAAKRRSCETAAAEWW
jgi:hypothetical protein